jgi:predicted metal-dependent phosphoesterase TrpH
MPTRQPFTALCRAAARPRSAGRADLHLHTVHSDGAYTPAQVVELARRAGLAAVAVTDHDTTAGVAPARAAAAGTGLEIIPGVEISAEYCGRGLHLLAYFVDGANASLAVALRRLRLSRVERFREMVGRLRGCGVHLDEEWVRTRAETGAVGRRHLAEQLVRTRRVGSVREAFQRYLGDAGRVAVPQVRLPASEALALVGGAGGVAGWAHPDMGCNRQALAELRGWGLAAVEVEYPACKASRGRQLRGLAAEFGLAVTGGSDCHGPGNYHQDVGACGVTATELEALRQRAAVSKPP